jgi:hypothetical protein
MKKNSIILYRNERKIDIYLFLHFRKKQKNRRFSKKYFEGTKSEKHIIRLILCTLTKFNNFIARSKLSSQNDFNHAF